MLHRAAQIPVHPFAVFSNAISPNLRLWRQRQHITMNHSFSVLTLNRPHQSSYRIVRPLTRRNTTSFPGSLFSDNNRGRDERLWERGWTEYSGIICASAKLYFRVTLSLLKLSNHELKTRTRYCGIPLLIKLSLHHNQDDSEEKRPLSRRFAVNFKNVGPTFLRITQMQSVPFASICVHPCFSFLLLYFSYVIQEF